MSYAPLRLLRAEGRYGRVGATRFTMIVAESSARSNLFLPWHGISRARRDIYLWRLITQSRRRGSECPELKEARKRANIRSETIRRARIMPWRMCAKRSPFPSPSLSHPLSYSFLLCLSLSLSVLKRQLRAHTISSVEQIAPATLPDDSFPRAPLRSLIFRLHGLASGNRETRPSVYALPLFFERSVISL